MKYDKLVRDRIPEIIKGDGKIPVTHIANDTEYRERLKAKLQEEVNEALEDINVSEELADVLEVVYAMADVKGITPEQLELIRKDKAEKRGGFKDKIILDETK